MNLRIGHRASMRGMQPHTCLGITLAWHALRNEGLETLWVSSITDRTHSPGSLHYHGSAFDLVPAPWPANIVPLADRVQEYLGPEWDVIAEESHIHCEWQPKEPCPT